MKAQAIGLIKKAATRSLLLLTKKEKSMPKKKPKMAPNTTARTIHGIITCRNRCVNCAYLAAIPLLSVLTHSTRGAIGLLQ